MGGVGGVGGVTEWAAGSVSVDVSIKTIKTFAKGTTC